MPGFYNEINVFTGNSNPKLAKDVCEYINLPLGRAEIFEFSNEIIIRKINERVR